MGRRAGWKTASGDAVPFERIDPDRHNRQRCAATIPPWTAGCGRTPAADRQVGVGVQGASDGGRPRLLPCLPGQPRGVRRCAVAAASCRLAALSFLPVGMPADEEGEDLTLSRYQPPVRFRCCGGAFGGGCGVDSRPAGQVLDLFDQRLCSESGGLGERVKQRNHDARTVLAAVTIASACLQRQRIAAGMRSRSSQRRAAISHDSGGTSLWTRWCRNCRPVRVPGQGTRNPLVHSAITLPVARSCGTHSPTSRRLCRTIRRPAIAGTSAI